jgi:hypothetical protein
MFPDYEYEEFVNLFWDIPEGYQDEFDNRDVLTLKIILAGDI